MEFYPTAEMQSVYSTAPDDWAKRIKGEEGGVDVRNKYAVITNTSESIFILIIFVI